MRQTKPTKGRGAPRAPHNADPQTLTAAEAKHIAEAVADKLQHEDGLAESFLLLLYALTYSPERESLLTAAEDASLTYSGSVQTALEHARAERLAALRSEKGGDGE